MDFTGSTDKMSKIDLRKFGHFLSGRTLPRQIMSEVEVDNASDVVLDFQGIVACNQSFLNELFQQLEAKRIKLNLIKIVGMESETLREMVERERSRYLQITKAI